MSFGMPPDPKLVHTASGRVVSYYDFGDPNGAPVFAMHGTPASGAGYVWTDERARARGIRLLAPDRPGIGHSDPLPHAKPLVADYAPELAATADALSIDAFSVLGYSGGGPFALAAAQAMPQRVQAAAIVAGAGQIGAWAAVKEYAPTDRRMTRLSTRAPALGHGALAVATRFSRVAPGITAWMANFELSPTDRVTMKQFASSRAAIALFTRACERGSKGALVDYATLARPWGMRVEEITVPTRCWHATDDPLVPPRHSEELVARVPGATLTRWPGEGHLAIIDRVGEVFDWLVEPAPGEVGRSDQTAH